MSKPYLILATYALTAEDMPLKYERVKGGYARVNQYSKARSARIKREADQLPANAKKALKTAVWRLKLTLKLLLYAYLAFIMLGWYLGDYLKRKTDNKVPPNTTDKQSQKPN